MHFQSKWIPIVEQKLQVWHVPQDLLTIENPPAEDNAELKQDTKPTFTQRTTKRIIYHIDQCAKQLHWLRKIFLSLKIKIKAPILENEISGDVTISKETQLNEHTKHFFKYLR